MAEKNDETTEPTTRREALEQAVAAAGEPTEVETTSEEVLEPLEAPEHWPAEHRERFRAADREWQEWHVDRDKAQSSAYTQRNQALAEEKRAIEPLQAAIKPWEHYLEQIGAAAPAMIGSLMSLEHAMRSGTPQQKYQSWVQFGEAYGLKPLQQRQHQGQRWGQGAPSYEEQIAAATAPLYQQNQQLQQHIMQREQQQQQYAQQQQIAQGEAMIEEFRAAKGENGKPLHPYFDELTQDMEDMGAAIAQRGGKPDIADLYERASRSNPAVYAKIQGDLKHAAKAEETKRAKQAEKDARATGGLAGGGGGGSAQPKSRKELLMEGLAEMRAAS